MEFTIDNLNIFDEDCVIRLEELIKNKINQFEQDKVYEFTVRFCMKTSYSNILEKYDSMAKFHENKKEGFEREINDRLKRQLHSFDDVLKKYNITANMLIICGIADNENTLCINFEVVQPDKILYTGKGENKKMQRCFSIVPNQPYIEEGYIKVLGKEANKMFKKLWEISGHDKDLIREILRLPSKASIGDMFKEFVIQYKGMIFPTSDEEFERDRNKFQKRLKEMIKEIDDVEKTV